MRTKELKERVTARKDEQEMKSKKMSIHNIFDQINRNFQVPGHSILQQILWTPKRPVINNKSHDLYFYTTEYVYNNDFIYILMNPI